MITIKVKNYQELEILRTEIISNRDPKKPCITICSGTGCLASGGEPVSKAFQEEIKKQIDEAMKKAEEKRKEQSTKAKTIKPTSEIKTLEKHIVEKAKKKAPC